MPASPLPRRHFFKAGMAAGTLATCGLTQAGLVQADENGDTTQFKEPERALSLNRDAEVIVCGAGPAGVTAAICAARAGAKVRLFEAHGSLGGVWTSSLLGYLLDFDKPGFNQELVRRLREQDAVRGQGMNGLSYDPEVMKWLLEELCVTAGVEVQLHTRVAAAYRRGTRLDTIVTESKSGRQAWHAPVFIDATGDGDLGAQAGCAFEIGQGDQCPCQPMSMCVLITASDIEGLRSVTHPASGEAGSVSQSKAAFLAELRRAGVDPSYASPTLFHIRNSLFIAMANHEYGVNATDANAVSRATMAARAELHQMFRALRKLGGPWSDVQIVATPEQIGVRDGRRIRGRYVVEKTDLIQGVVHDDAVVKAAFPVDVHNLAKNVGKPVSNEGVKVRPYDIPLRALIARDVDGLMMAGRCISGDFIAHASYRVTGNAVAMGEAAGVAASVAAKSGKLPHEVRWNDVQSKLQQVRAS